MSTPAQLVVDNRSALASLRAYAGLVTNWAVANQKISIQLYGWVIRNYTRQGALIGGWAPLARQTVRAKEREGYSSNILLRTGVLKNNYAFYHTNEEAGVGNRIPYSLFHEEGSPARGLPPRRQMPNEEEMQKMAGEVLSVHLQSAAERGIR